jgi:polar amino acid transport system substrate-binding protein
MNIFARRLVVCFLFLLFAVFICTAFPSPAAGKKESPGTITVSLSGGWPPYLIVDADGKVMEKENKGILMDIFTEIVRTLEYRVNFVSYPEKRDMVMLDKGLIDFRFDGLKWVDSPDRYFWSDPIIKSSDVLVLRKNDPVRFKDIGALAEKRLITHIGYNYPTLEPYFTSGRIRRSDAPSHQSMLRMLKAERGDAAVMNKRVALWVMKNSRFLSQSEFSFSNPVDSSPMALQYTSRKWHGFIRNFNCELSKMKADGRVKEILAGYK